MVGWVVVFVDDIIMIYDTEYERSIALIITAMLDAVAIPMAWHETIVDATNLWVGFLSRVNIPESCHTEEKTQWWTMSQVTARKRV